MGAARAGSPRRVLHCGQNQLYWECEELIASENFPTGIPGIGSVKDSVRLLSSLSLSDKLELWRTLVKRYSVLDLSFPKKDKLFAFEGVARRMQTSFASSSSIRSEPHRVEHSPNFDVAYGHTLWRAKIAYGLLWWGKIRLV
jgi:hypothetical protein